MSVVDILHTRKIHEYLISGSGIGLSIVTKSFKVSQLQYVLYVRLVSL